MRNIKSLKGHRHYLRSEFSNFISPFLKSRMVNKGNVNASSKFERKISSSKKDIQFETLCFVNKVVIL